jgi:hypothetical protein
MAEDNDERQNYRGKLQVILHTCLLYNSSKALGNHVNYVLHGKGNKGFKDKNKSLSQLESIYNKLCLETSKNTNKEVDLDELLDNYKAVSECLAPSGKLHLRRTYSCNLYKPNEQHFQRNKILLFALLDYTFDKNEAIKKYTSIFCMNKYVKIAEKFEGYSKEIVLFEPLILLLMTGLLPKYDSKQTTADNILNDFDLLYEFLSEYFQQSVVVKNLKDSLLEDLSLRVNTFKDCKNNTDPLTEIDELPINRLTLIRETKKFLDALRICSNRQQLGKHINSLKSLVLTPDIEGIWTNIEGISTNFWKFEKIRKGYILTNFEKKSDDYGRDIIEYTRFICYIIQNILTISNFKLIRDIIQNNGNIKKELMVSFLVDFESVYQGKGKYRINKISLSSSSNSKPHDWFSPRLFYRVQENEHYKEYESLIDKLPLVNKNPEEYISRTNLALITRLFLYIPIDENIRMHIHALNLESQSTYLKVPKKLNLALQDVDLNSSFYIMVFEDKTVYVVSFDHWLFWEITTPEQRRELGIELVKVDGVRDL